MTAPIKYVTCGYCCDLMLCAKTVRGYVKIGYGSAMNYDRVQFGNVST